MYLPDKIIDEMTEDELRGLVKKLIKVCNCDAEELCAQKDVIDSFDSLYKAQKRAASVYACNWHHKSGLYRMEALLRDKYLTASERVELPDANITFNDVYTPESSI